PMGALACLTTGFDVVARNPYLILIPFMMDLFLWLGPRLSLAPIFDAMQRFIREWVITGLADGDLAEAYAMTVQVLKELSAGYNMFSVLHPAPLLGVPSLMTNQLTVDRPFGVRPDIIIPSVLLVLPLYIILVVAGLALSAFYLRWVGRRVIAETESQLSGSRSVLALWGSLLLLSLVLLVALSVLGMAVLFFASFIGLFWMPLAWFIMLVASSFGLFVAVHLMFAIPGIVQLRRGLFQAIKESMLLTRADFFNVSFLLLLIFVISRGFNFVWTLPAFDSWSAVIGLVGHAFVSTALTATLFIFYQERLNYLEILQHIRAANAQSIVLK
ncbi:MAG: hypothetical protein P1S60_12090, partial [Anaerolineae bacterium]|nr:hypothetical protein [Anaerolineae bacterium]